MQMTVLVTGSGGVIGKAVRRLASEYPGYRYEFATSASADLTSADACRDLFDRVKPDWVLHLAALSGGIGLTKAHPARVLRDNVLMNINVLECARAHSVKKTVMTLSSGMYPPEAPMPLAEDSIHNGPAHPSNYSYSYAKRLVEPLIHSYRAEFGMNVIGLIPNGVFGEGDNFSTEDSTLVAALIRRFYEGRNGTDPLIVWGDGSPLREFTYADDMARVYMWCLENYDQAQILNVGTTEERSVKDIALLIGNALGIATSRLSFDTTKPSGVPRKTTDNSRFVKLSGFEYTPFEVGLRRTVQWYAVAAQQGEVNTRSKINK